MNEKTIWDFLLKKTGNPYGTAAIMGNLMAESSLKPTCATGKNKTANYVDDADAGRIDFIHDSVAFGLVQWCYWSRKQALLEYAKSQGKSVGDLTMQLEFMLKEMTGYSTVYNAVMKATSIREASDIIMLKYERPATKTEAAKKKRADYGQKFFDQFSKETPPTPQGKMVVARVSVNIRAGDGKTFAKLGSLAARQSLQYVATAENGWYAVRYKNQVGWVSNEFATLKT